MSALKLAGHLLWTAIRICLTIFLAITIGGFRGASKARMSSSSPRD